MTSSHANKREGEYVRRTGKLSKKQQTANHIKDIFLMADDISDYTNRLRAENIEIYVRGDNGLCGEKQQTTDRQQGSDNHRGESEQTKQQQSQQTPQPQTDYDAMVSKRLAELQKRHQQKNSTEQNKVK